MATPLPHLLCENLCCKRFYMFSEMRDLVLEDLQTAGYENYWCRHTSTDTGPDGGWVQYERCAPGRQCYAPRPDNTPLGARLLLEPASDPGPETTEQPAHSQPLTLDT
jgi:hypothetical protein